MGRVQSGLRAGRTLALALADWALVLLVCIVPIGFMLTRAFGTADPITLEVELTGRLDAFRALFSPTYRIVILRSYALSAATVVMCLIVGTPTALALSRLSGRRRSIGLFVLMLPSFVSFTVRMAALQGVLANGGPVESLFGVRWLYRTPAVLIGMITAYVPLFVIPVYAAFARTSAAVIDAAADLGARPLRQFWSVTLPLATPGLVTGSALVGVLSLGEFVIPSVLGGGKVLLLGTVLAERGAGRDQPIGGAITIILLTSIATVALLAIRLRRRLDATTVER